MASSFDPAALLSDAVMARLTDLRVDKAPQIHQIAAARNRRPQLSSDGRLNLIAIDHPARGVTAAAGEPLAMADRRSLLARTIRALEDTGVDGVVATTDIIEELLLLHGIAEGAHAGFLHRKLLVGSLNRGGLAGSAWELEDPWTGPSAKACASLRLDGAKLLLRVALEERDSLPTLTFAANAISAMHAQGIPCFVEPLVVHKHDGGWAVDHDAARLAQLVGVTTALGDSSARVWLKLPMVEQMATVARATTQPSLLLGGATHDDAAGFIRQVHAAMQAGHNMRGVVLGRNVLVPRDADPRAIAAAVSAVVHQRASLDAALAVLAAPPPAITPLTPSPS